MTSNRSRYRSKSGEASDPASRTSTEPVLSELQRVSDKVEQHLTQPGRVAAQDFRRVVRYRRCQCDAFFSGVAHEQLNDVIDDTAQFEVDRLDLQLTGLDLGEIEDVVEQGQQGLGGIARVLT